MLLRFGLRIQAIQSLLIDSHPLSQGRGIKHLCLKCISGFVLSEAHLQECHYSVDLIMCEFPGKVLFTPEQKLSGGRREERK